LRSPSLFLFAWSETARRNVCHRRDVDSELIWKRAAEGGWVLDRIEPEYQIAIFENVDLGDDDEEDEYDED
jgi:hypothetical protein